MNPGAEAQGVPTVPVPEAAPPAEPPMGDVEYALEFKRLRIGMAYLQDIRCDDMLARVARCSTIAPVLDPTLYIHGRERLEAVDDLLRAASRFQAAARRFEGRMVKTEPAARRSLEFLAQARPNGKAAEVLERAADEPLNSGDGSYRP